MVNRIQPFGLNPCGQIAGSTSLVGGVYGERLEGGGLGRGSQRRNRSLRFRPRAVHVLAVAQYGRISKPRPRRAHNQSRTDPLQNSRREELGGYKLTATNPKGYLLVAQGNAMLADQLVADLQTFRDLGLDVYIFDYRGYGISKGKSRLAAIAADYFEIVSYLNPLGYAKRLLYGISMGGIILLNAVGRSQMYTRLVVDSSPSRISDFGCPERYDPVVHLPEDSSRLMIISGAKDQVVTPSQMDELVRVGGSRRGRVLLDNEFAHPYQDLSDAIHRRRQNEVAAFLLQD